MITATIEFNVDELKSLLALMGEGHRLYGVVYDAIERLELIDMSDWDDCGDACKL